MESGIPNIPNILQLKTAMEIFFVALVLVGIQRGTKCGLDNLRQQREQIKARRQQLYEHIDALEVWCADRKQEYQEWYKQYFVASLTIPSDDIKRFTPLKRTMEDCVLRLTVHGDLPMTTLSTAELQTLSTDSPQRLTDEWDVLLNQHMARYELEWQEYQDIARKYTNPDQTKQQLHQDLDDQITSVWGASNKYTLPNEITQLIQDTKNTLNTDFRYIQQDEGSVMAYQQATEVFVRNTQRILRELDPWKESLEDLDTWYNASKQLPLPKLIETQAQISELIAELHTINHAVAQSQHNRKIVKRLRKAIAILRAYTPANWQSAYVIYNDYGSILSAAKAIKKDLVTKIEDTRELVDNYPHRLHVLDAQYQRLQSKKSKNKSHINKLLEYDKLIATLPTYLDANSDLKEIKKTLTKLEQVLRYV